MIDSRSSAEEAVKRLSPEQAIELACRWTEFALPVWETAYPDDDRPERAIEFARRLLNAGDDNYAFLIAAYATAAAAEADAAAYASAAAVAYAAANVAHAVGNAATNCDAFEYAAEAATRVAYATNWPIVDLVYRRYRAELLNVPPELLDAWRNGEPMAEEIINDWLEERGMPPIASPRINDA